MINKSKSAHVISCEVYSEVVDHTEQPCHMSTLKSRLVHNFHLNSAKATIGRIDITFTFAE